MHFTDFTVGRLIFASAIMAATPCAIACGIYRPRPPDDLLQLQKDRPPQPHGVECHLSQCSRRCVWHPRSKKSRKLRSATCPLALINHKFILSPVVSASGSMFMVRNTPPMWHQRPARKRRRRSIYPPADRDNNNQREARLTRRRNACGITIYLLM